ncbi:MAG TPA: PAC2 family protein, partial [Acidimicrobiales bacterium]|nr:PAC2 family protein [Acidimicrobiales bacterium]
PCPRLRVGTDLAGSGVMFLTGPEPDYRWRPFAQEVTDIAVELGVRLVVGLGAFPAATPHTRPIRLSSTSSDPSLSHQIGYRPGSIEVPARIVDVIGTTCAEVGIPSIGLLARVPHYVGAMPFPAASVALLDGLAKIADLTIDTDSLARTAASGLAQVDELIAQSEEHAEMVRQLEEQYGDNDGIPIVSEVDIPSGDEIAAELERYLRGESQ